jgi:hypothetical protein
MPSLRALLAFATVVVGCQDEGELAAQRRRVDSVMMAQYQAQLAVDSKLAAAVRIADSASVKACVLIQQLETEGQALDANQSTREIRLRSQAAQVRANAIVITTPPEWTTRVKGEAYRCPPPLKPELPGTGK